MLKQLTPIGKSSAEPRNICRAAELSNNRRTVQQFPNRAICSRVANKSLMPQLCAVSKLKISPSPRHLPSWKESWGERGSAAKVSAMFNK
jgi:hypothetical protein